MNTSKVTTSAKTNEIKSIITFIPLFDYTSVFDLKKGDVVYNRISFAYDVVEVLTSNEVLVSERQSATHAICKINDNSWTIKVECVRKSDISSLNYCEQKQIPFKDESI